MEETYGNLVYRGNILKNWGRGRRYTAITKLLWGKLIIWEKMFPLTPCTKIYSREIKYLNVKKKNFKAFNRKYRRLSL